MINKVLVAMSGGVDSSVAALLLKQQGYECCGCTMKLFGSDLLPEKTEKSCCSLDDVEDARGVAFRLGMPYYVFNLSDDFEEKVINRFITSYASGKTPNPCIDCNRYLKFEKLYERAMVLDCDAIATGHYARIEYDGEKYLLKKAAAPEKDQSYVLYSLSQEQLARTLFPLGSLQKEQTRALAQQFGFRNAYKPDSQDICFVPDGNYASFITRTTGLTFPEGDFIDREGHVLGRHKGIIHYTVGQRRGLGIAARAPLYVAAIDTEKNTVTLTEKEGLFARTVYAEDIRETYPCALDGEKHVKAKIRYRHQEQPATIIRDGDRLVLQFDEPQRAPTPGQAAVVYDGDVVLGGGVITGAGE